MSRLKLTAEQRVVLAFFACHRAGAMRLHGRWVWADDIRRDPALAISFIKNRAEDYRDCEMLRQWLAPRGKAVRQ